MNRFKIIAVLLIATLAMANSFASAIKLLHCHIPARDKPNNIQCIYSVYGHKINKPNAFSKLYINTNMPYALCRNTLCNIDPEKPTMAICNCPVINTNKHIPAWKKISVGTVFFEIIHPKYKKEQLTSVPANFSLVYLDKPSEYKTVTCQFDEPTEWANCFGRRCDVVYETRNGKSVPIAKCRCKLIKTTVFVSAGPHNTNECKTPAGKVWSAMTERQAQNDIGVLMDTYKRFHPQSPLVKSTQ